MTDLKNKKYTADDVDILNEREHVRKRTPMFLGDVNVATYNILELNGTSLEPVEVAFVPALYKAVGEIIDNSLDEFSHINIPSKILTISALPSAGRYDISDNGRGIPIEQKKVRTPTGKTEEKWVPELLLANLRSGRNFRDSPDKNIGIIGMNGVGSSVTNFCSSEFEVIIQRDRQQYTQLFTDGANKIGRPIITKTTNTKTGTRVKFELDPTVFVHGTALPDQLIHNRAIEIAATNPGVTVVYNSEKIKFKNGMSDVISRLAGNKSIGTFAISTAEATGEIYVIPNSHASVDERMFTWVNSSYLFDGGKCNTQFLNAFIDKAIEAVEKKGSKSKITVTKNDVRYGLTIIATLKLKSPSYDSQAKTRLSGPDLRKDFVSGVEDNWKQFAKQFDGWLDECAVRAAIRQNKAATNSMDEDIKKKGKVKVDGLLDATSRIRSDCMLFVVEGECLYEHTPIKVVGDAGFVDKLISEVEVGDLVITHAGNLKPVMSVHKSVKPVTQLILINGETIKCSPDHRWLVYSKDVEQFQWLPTNELTTNHQMVRSKLHRFISCERFDIRSNALEDSTKYPYVICSNSETMLSSASHRWIVLNTETLNVSTVQCDQLNPDIHWLVLYRDER